MYISLKALTYSTLGTLLLLFILSDTPVAHARSLTQTNSKRSSLVAKRALLGSFLPIPEVNEPPKAADPVPAPAPAAPPATPPPSPPSPPPPAPAKDPEPVSEPATSSPPKSQPGPGLVEQLLGPDPDPTKHESPASPPPVSPASTSSTPSTTSDTEHKKKPTQAAGTTTTGGSKTQDDDDSPGTKGSTSASSSPGTNGAGQDSATAINKNAAKVTTPKEGLSSGIVTMIVLVVLAVLAAILLSCYRIRQSRERRKERETCWDEDILKNHVGGVGYNNGSSGNSIDVKSEALGDGGCTPSAVEAAYAGRGSLGGTSLRDNGNGGGNTGTSVYGGTYSPYSQHAHAYSHGHQQQQGYGGGGGYGGSYY